MNSLKTLCEEMLDDSRVIGVVGKDPRGNTKTLFKGTVLDVWRNRKGVLSNYMYADVIDIAPATIHLDSETERKGLKVTILAKYGFKED